MLNWVDCSEGLPHLKLLRSLQDAEVGRGGDALLQRVQEHPLEVQHLRQAAKQRLHLVAHLSILV